MSSSPLRRFISITLLVAGLSLVAPALEARVRPTGPDDSSFSLRFDGAGFLDRLWTAISSLWAADGPRLDPNGNA